MQGFGIFVTVDKLITQPSDMKGLKFRVAETPLHLDIFRALGASPTPMPYGEIYSGLQNKVIDGLEEWTSAPSRWKSTTKSPRMFLFPSTSPGRPS